VKSLKSLSVAVLRNAGLLCDVDTTRDEIRLIARIEKEGEPFLTVTLPTFRRDFERSLAAGRIVDDFSTAFKRHRARSGLPLFLGGFLRRVFDCDGTLLGCPSIEAIRALRQITGLFEKFFEVCDEKHERASIEAYRVCEEEMRDVWIDPGLLRELSLVAHWLFGVQFRTLDDLCRQGDLIPRHGPGATAEGLVGNNKYDIPSWPKRLDLEFPAADYVIAGYSHDRVLQSISMPEPESETPVRVVSVPKTASKARIIAIEPVAMQYAQQCLLRAFMERFNGSAPCVDLSNQDRNRIMANLGSIEGSLATLDLSEASDRVSISLVDAIFRFAPALLASLKSCRSIRAALPDGDVLSLAKFASMGSATCFPVESVCFATVAVNAVRRALKVPLRALFGRSCRKPKAREGKGRIGRLLSAVFNEIRVFGDDIIVPTEHVHVVLSDLVRVYSRPNPSKSFWTGLFRESCGGEYYAGSDVSIFRLRQRLPQDMSDGKRLLGLISFRNHAYMGGYWYVAQWCDDLLRTMRVPMPIVEPSSPVVGRSSVAFSWTPQRFHADYQTPLVRGLMVAPRIPKNESSDHGKLLKCLLPGRVEPFDDPQHLSRSGRPNTVRTKVRWGTPY